MAEFVVDELETIQICDRDRQRVVDRMRDFDFRRQALAESGAIHDARQSVLLRPPLEREAAFAQGRNQPFLL